MRCTRVWGRLCRLRSNALMGTDQGDSLAAVSAGAALEEGVGAWVDLEAAIRA